MTRYLYRFVAEDSALDMVEFALLAGLIALVSILAITNIGGSISVPCGDGRNPSPSGEERGVVVWSRAPTKGAHAFPSAHPALQALMWGAVAIGVVVEIRLVTDFLGTIHNFVDPGGAHLQ